jgi:hypothetical protein
MKFPVTCVGTVKNNSTQKSYGTIILAVIAACIVVVATYVFNISEQNSVVDQTQRNMVVSVKQAHLLGGGKQKVIAFFRQQHIASTEQYGLLEGQGWDEFANKNVSAYTLGMIISGESDVFAHTRGFLGCTKVWSLDVGVLFNKKGKVIGVEVVPDYYGCDP